MSHFSQYISFSLKHKPIFIPNSDNIRLSQCPRALTGKKFPETGIGPGVEEWNNPQLGGNQFQLLAGVRTHPVDPAKSHNAGALAARANYHFDPGWTRGGQPGGGGPKPFDQCPRHYLNHLTITIVSSPNCVHGEEVLGPRSQKYVKSHKSGYQTEVAEAEVPITQAE